MDREEAGRKAGNDSANALVTLLTYCLDETDLMEVPVAARLIELAVTEIRNAYLPPSGDSAATKLSA